MQLLPFKLNQDRRLIPIAWVAEVEGDKVRLSINGDGAETFEEVDGHS